MPRPRKTETDTRMHRLNLRFTAAEHATLRQAALAAGAGATEFARRAVLGTAAVTNEQPLVSGPVLDPAAVAALNRVGANLNQLARRANAGDVLQPSELPDALAALAQQLDRIEALVMPALERG